jgi:hypothetical protein
MRREGLFFLLQPSLWLTVLLILVGCSSGSGVAPPTVPAIGESGPAMPDGLASTATDHNRYLWSYHLIKVDPSTNEIEVIPVRQALAHWNVIRFLEQGPCTNCLSLDGVTPNPDGTLSVSVRIRHPFSNPNLTGFDVRGIAMFSGSRLFPDSGLVMSDRTLGEGELLNPDGYTTLYNPITIGHGLEGYIRGKLATAIAPYAMLNGYKRFVSDDPANTRNAFYAGDEITVTYEIDMPDPPHLWIFGYAVDACWAPPIHKPVDDPMTDFGPEANCPEAWKIAVPSTYPDDGLTECCGEARLTIEIYDWQGRDDAHPVLVECPELFDHHVQATFKSDGIGFTTCEAVVRNPNKAPVGTYTALVSAEAQENEPATKPWLDLTAYRTVELEVVEAVKDAPTAMAAAGVTSVYVDELISFDASASHDNDCDNQSIAKYEWDWEYDGVYDEGGKRAEHSWAGAGTYFVQLRVTDDEGQTDILDAPIEISIRQGGDPYDPVDVTPPPLNFNPYGIDVDGNYAYVTAGVNGLHIFDISDPENPTWIHRVDTPSGAIRVPPSGGYAYVTNGSGLQVIDVDPPESAYLVHSVDTPGGASGVAVSGTYAYVADSDPEPGIGNLHIIDISTPEAAYIVKSVDIPPGADDVAVSGGYACIANGYSGLSIVDVDPPESAYVVKTVSAPVAEYPTGVAASGGYAYVAISDHSLQIVDIDPPESAYTVKSIEGAGSHIRLSGDYAYAAGYGLHIIDIVLPEDAGIVKSVDVPGSARGIAVSAGYAYITCSSGLQIVDIDPLESACLVNSIVTLCSARAVAVSGDYACVADFYSGFYIFDIDPPESAYILKQVDMPGSPRAVAVSVGFAYVSVSGLQVIDIDPPESAHIVGSVAYSGSPRGIAISGGYAYTACSLGGLQIIDISMPAWAFVNKTVDTPGSAYGVAASGGYAYVADQDSGLQIIDVDPVKSAYIVNSVATPGSARGVALSGGYAYVADHDSGLQIVDVDPPESACIVNTVDTPGFADVVAVSGGYAYVADLYDAGLQIIDVDPPESACIVSSVVPPYSSQGVAVSGQYAYVADDSGGLRIIRLW